MACHIVLHHSEIFTVFISTSLRNKFRNLRNLIFLFQIMNQLAVCGEK